MSAVLQRADTFIVATFAGLDALAVYTAAEFITRVIANPRYLFDHIIAPVLAEALYMHDRARVRYNLALVTRWVITACAPIAVTVIVLRAEILGLYGSAFAKGTGVVVILAVHHLIVGCLGLTPYVLAMGGRARLFVVNNMVAAGLNIALGVVLVPRFGITGAAISRPRERGRVPDRADDRNLDAGARSPLHRGAARSRWRRAWSRWPSRSALHGLIVPAGRRASRS